MKYKIYFDKKVNGVGPTGSSVLAVGESPGNDECIFGEPFVGASGEILNNCLARNGIFRESIRIENLVNLRPWDNKFENVLNTPVLEYGLSRIHQYIQTYRPVAIAALGNYPMYYLTGKGKKAKGSIIGIGNWRGSILPYRDESGKIHEDIKVIPCFHPSAVNRERSLYPIFDADIRKVAQESKFRGLNYPERNIIINPDGLEYFHVRDILKKADFNAIDIETIKRSTIILSISFSPDKDNAFVFNFDNPERIKMIGELLALNTRKIFHYGTFDTTQLKLNGYLIGLDEDSVRLQRPYFFDTYVACHVLEPELPKTLAYETSVRTRQPYYKNEGKEDSDQKGWSKKADRNRLYVYNGKDTCVDFEIFEQQFIEIDGLPKASRNIFDFEMESLYTQTHISNSGMLIDPIRLKLLEEAMIARWAKLQYPLDMIAGFEVNARSPLLKDWLYKTEKEGGLGLPPKYKNKRVTTDDDALVTLIAWCKKKERESVRDDTKKKYRNRLNIIRTIREIREIRQRLSMYVNSKQSSDGRTRATYKWGPETGRWAASKYVDGTGYNHQTNPRDPVVVPDEDYAKYKNEIKLLQELEPEPEEDEDEITA